MHLLPEEVLLLVLTVKIGQGSPQLAEPPHRGRTLVDVGSGTTVRSHHAPEDEGSLRQPLIDPPSGIRPGMTAEVTFSLARVEADAGTGEEFMLPLAAVLPEADGAFSVFVFDAETSTVSKRPVQMRGVGENDLAIVEGLAAGDIIATAGVSFLADGLQVTLLDEEPVRNAP